MSEIKKIVLLVPEYGFGFINQAKALAIGFKKLDISCRVIRVEGNFPEQEIRQFGQDLLIGVGSWHDYKNFVEIPSGMGMRSVPWVVSDDVFDGLKDEYNRLELVLTTSEHCKRLFTEGGMKPEIIKVIPEAVDTDFWRMEDEAELTKFMKLISISDPEVKLPGFFDLEEVRKKQIPIIFTTGGDATNKGALEVITALGSLGKEIPWIYVIKTWPFEESFGKSIKEMAKAREFGMADRIRYIVGEFSQEFMRHLMCMCDVYAAPSRSEGFGLPLVEAQLCGKPVVSLKATSTQETVIDQETGLLAESEMAEGRPRAVIESLAQKLKLILTDREMRQVMGRKAAVHAFSCYNPELVAKMFLQSLSAVK